MIKNIINVPFKNIKILNKNIIKIRVNNVNLYLKNKFLIKRFTSYLKLNIEQFKKLNINDINKIISKKSGNIKFLIKKKKNKLYIHNFVRNNNQFIFKNEIKKELSSILDGIFKIEINKNYYYVKIDNINNNDIYIIVSINYLSKIGISIKLSVNKDITLIKKNIRPTYNWDIKFKNNLINILNAWNKLKNNSNNDILFLIQIFKDFNINNIYKKIIVDKLI